MSRAAQACPPHLVGCTVVEEAFVCPTGGGFENETWRVQVNDAWLTISQLLRRRSVDDVTVELVDGHDPNGVESSGTLPPQTAFHRRTYVVAPIGTHLWRRVIRPMIDRTKTFRDYLSAGDVSVVRQPFDDYFVLRGPERLVSLAQDVERRSRPKAHAAEPMTREQTHRYAGAILSLLDDGAPTTTPMRYARTGTYAPLGQARVPEAPGASPPARVLPPRSRGPSPSLARDGERRRKSHGS